MDSKGTFSCNNCDRFYSTQKSLNKHIKKNHLINDIVVENEDEQVITEDIFFENSIDNNDVSMIDSVASTAFDNSNLQSEQYLTEATDNKYLNFFLKYLSKPEMPRKYVIEMVADLKNVVKEKVQDESVVKALNELPSTEYQIETSLKKLNVFIDCKTICIHRTSEPYIDYNNEPHIRNIEYFVKIYPLLDLFSAIFTQTNLFQYISGYYESIRNKTNNSMMESLCESEYFKNVRLQVCNKFGDNTENVLILPLCIYIDEFEPNNPLGSRANYKKVAGVYCKIPCLAQLLQSKIFSIFKLGYFHGDDRKKFGNERVLSPFKDELNFLAENLIKVNHTKYTSVRLIPCCLLGDNLGLNQIMDGTEGFNTEKACRFCFLNRSEHDYFYGCNDQSLYTKDNYEHMIHQSNSCFKKESIWNDLHFFHVVENPIADPLHDCLEGICKYITWF